LDYYFDGNAVAMDATTALPFKPDTFDNLC